MKNKSVNTASFYYSLNMLKLLQDMNLVTEDEVAKIKKQLKAAQIILKSSRFSLDLYRTSVYCCVAERQKSQKGVIKDENNRNHGREKRE